MESVIMPTIRTVDELRAICSRVSEEFQSKRRVLSFAEYLELFIADPVRHSRDASAYVRGAFDHYGKREVERPWGKSTWYNLFDLPWLDRAEARRESLVGQEKVQGELYRVLSNFVREGRPNRLPVLHGPNGSAKSTIAACLMRALEHYSTLDEGALYRFHWVFPNRNTLRGSIGFGDAAERAQDTASFAHLPEDKIDSRLFVEVRDHPLFLVPQVQRQDLLERICKSKGVVEPLTQRTLRGQLSHKNKEVFEALLSSYEGDLEQVLRHVQVERYFISRHYRCGAVTIGPQLSVDAGERQITADRSLGALPTSLQAITLFEAFGELIEASGGMLEFSDLLKRPLDAFKYLQSSVETGEVNLRSQNVQLNCFMLASANELQLSAFKEHPEFQSFRGRLELIKSPYLRSWVEEVAIYDAQIAPQIRRHVAPHATRMAAMFAVLTRMRRPNPDKYESPLRGIVSELSAFEKMDLYSTGKPPERLDDEAQKLIKAAIPRLYDEGDAYVIYEGSVGASPREMRTVLLDASQSTQYSCMSPFAVLIELEHLCRRTNEYAWLQEEKQTGSYHDFEGFRKLLRTRLLDLMEDEFRISTGLVDDSSYATLLVRYVNHVSHWVKGEKVQNAVTGQLEPPDERLMQEVEILLKSADDTRERRHALISNIAAWAIEHPGIRIEDSPVFASYLRRLRDAVFGERRQAVARLVRDVAVLIRGSGTGLDAAQRRAAQRCLDVLCQRFGYEPESAADAAGALIRERFAEILS
jgi:predicted Ser/Thr protein kinase